MGYIKRLRKELKILQKNYPNGGGEIGAILYDKDDYTVWNAFIKGPKDSPYEGGKFYMKITFPSNYPFRPPSVRFETRCYHPNLSPDGSICLDILKGNWSPALSAEKLLLSIQNLLTDPNAGDPLDSSAGNLYLKDRPAFDKKVRSMVQEHAMNG